MNSLYIHVGMINLNTVIEAVSPLSTLSLIVSCSTILFFLVVSPARKILLKFSGGLAAVASPTAAGIGFLRPIFTFVCFVGILALVAYLPIIIMN